jgi:signal transduction histidine kinase/CheY-like chemotaxis protein
MAVKVRSDRKSIRLVVKTMGLALVLILGIGVPAGFGVMTYLGARTDLQNHAQLSTAAIEGHIYKTPEMWAFQIERLEGLLSTRSADHRVVERALIVDGAVIAATVTAAEHHAAIGDNRPGPVMPWPRTSVYEPVFLRLKPVAHVRVTATIRPLLINLGLVWLGFAFLAAISYRGLAVTPLRLLDRTMSELRGAAKRARAADIAKSEFLATMSHEIRTPLNGVLGSAELLQTTKLDERQTMFADIIRNSGRSLLSVINDILDFSKIDSGYLEIDPQPFKLSAIGDEPARLIAHAAEKKGLELAVRMQPGLPLGAVGDLGRIRQVVTNLLSNAVKFTDSGQIVIDVSGTERTGGNGGRHIALRVEVRDTGIGIPPGQVEKVFGRFSQIDSSSTRRHEGTGLGLSIARGLVELMGGRIGAESVPGAGSTFWFTLTLPVGNGAGRKRLAPVAVEGKHVLVIDDNETNRCILQELLGAWRLADASAASGKEGMQRLINAAGQGHPFDLVILDHHMPGMNGEDVVRAVRSTPGIEDTPIILLTSIEELGTRATQDALGVQGYLVKPAPASKLFDTIVNVLAENAAARRAEPCEAEADSASQTPTDGRSVNVLLVEDHEINRIVAEQMLLQMGLNHVTAENGEVAVVRFEETRPELILMDVSMPVMNGYEATRRIRELEQAGGLGRTPIIGLTAHAMQGAREKCLAAGMDDYIPKPVSVAALAALIQKWCADQASDGGTGEPGPAPDPDQGIVMVAAQ